MTDEERLKYIDEELNKPRPRFRRHVDTEEVSTYYKKLWALELERYELRFKLYGNKHWTRKMEPPKGIMDSLNKVSIDHLMGDSSQSSPIPVEYTDDDCNA